MSNLKAVVLAAGREGIAAEAQAIVLRPLGNRRVIDYVIENARQFVAPEDLYIVVGHRQEEVMAHLGPSAYPYVIQREQLGTAHAVLQLRPLLSEFDGDLLVLYGDTPLFRPDSIRGLLNRHRLRRAQLTLLTAVVEGTFPYGRVVRSQDGRIVDVVEEADATPEVRRIRELNLGAYVVRAGTIFALLAAPDAPARLPDCVRQLIRRGLRVESYQTYDQGEVLGINTDSDLEQAEFILQKRLYRPRRHEEQTQIRFGTGGWRAIIGEGFTLHNVRRLAQALANSIIRADDAGSPAAAAPGACVVIGYDSRFLSDRAAEAAAEVFAGNNVPVVLLPEAAPTPLITYATAAERALYGLAFTASHNPPEWNGLKVFRSDGSLLLEEETQRIEEETNRLSPADVIRTELDLALQAGVVQRRDFTNPYVDAVEALIDLEAIRNAGLRVIVDPMYGVGQLTLGIILTEARCRVTFIHERHNPLFGGRSPAPDLDALRLLITHIKDDTYDLGLAMDGDADRIAIVDERGEYITVNDILLLLYWYLHEVRGERGGVVRNLATTHLLDRLAARVGETCIEVPVGFKHIAAAMVRHGALLGGESSGGLTIRGHILGKDGIFAAALVVEMLARTGARISALRERIYALTGRLYVREENLPATPDMRVVVPRRLSQASTTALGPYRVLRVSHLDGTKFYLEHDNWALVRFSGTEPVLRLFAEADSPEKAQELLDHLRQLVLANP